MIREEKVLLRIYTVETARHDGHSLVEALLRTAREQGLAGITVFRGIAGFGRKGHVHSTRLVELSGNLPVVIDIIDAADRVEAFAEKVVPWVREGLVTQETVQVLKAEETIQL